MADALSIINALIKDLSPEKRRLMARALLPHEPIAIVGIGCRFPGDVNDPQSFWRLLRGSLDVITEVPPSRWDVAPFTEPGTPSTERIISRFGGFISNPFAFDAHFFGISAREALHMDPQQRLMLEVSWEAFEHAGICPEQLSESPTGVFVGVGSFDYALDLFSNVNDVDAYTASGASHSIVANRLSYTFNLRGPSVAVDTACSASLTAIHLACQSLKAGECRVALAGGVHLLLNPLYTVALSRFGMMAPDGRCKTFDARANGFVRGEGCGVAVLKRLSDAMADSDTVLAIIRGSAVNQDGRSAGLTAPNGPAQEAVMRSALEDARVEPQSVQFLETHGTGTSLGDPIEVESILGVYERNANSPAGMSPAAKPPLYLGAVKTNLGHLETAAGIAGLIKCVLALQHAEIPPNLHLRHLNPRIPIVDSRLKLPSTCIPWPRSELGPRRAAVSSFGFGGSNAHVVLEEGPPHPQSAPAELLLDASFTGPGAFLVPISGKRPEALFAQVKTLSTFLEHLPDPGANEHALLGNLAYTASLRRTHFSHRAVFSASNLQQLKSALISWLESPPARDPTSTHTVPRLAFVFSGQGSQWAEMGRALFDDSSAFARAIDACQRALTSLVPWSIYDEIRRPEAQSRLQDTAIAQPILCAVQIGLVRVLRHLGLEPSWVIGHSVGELAAAECAGILTLEEAMRLAVLRGKSMHYAFGNGAMLVVPLSLDLLTQRYFSPDIAPTVSLAELTVAATNAPSEIVLSGPIASIDSMNDYLNEQGLATRRIPGNYAFHSPQMRQAGLWLKNQLHWLHPRPASLPIISTLTGELAPGAAFDPAYWAAQLQEPVQFQKGARLLIAEPDCIFVEVGAHPVLCPAIRDFARASNLHRHTLATLRRGNNASDSLLTTAARIYELGGSLRWAALNGGHCHLPDFPRYAWQHEDFRVTPRSFIRTSESAREAQPTDEGPSVSESWGLRIFSPSADRAFARMLLDLNRFPGLDDHRIAGHVVVPATFWLEVVRSTIQTLVSSDVLELSNVDFLNALGLRPNHVYLVQIELTRIENASAQRGGRFSWRITSTSFDASGDVKGFSESWILHVSGHALVMAPDQISPPMALSIDPLRSLCSEQISGDRHYQHRAAQGISYGAGFRLVREIRRGGTGQSRVILAELRDACVHDPNHELEARLVARAALFDAALQVIGELPDRSLEETLVPVHIALAQYFRVPSQSTLVHVRPVLLPRRAASSESAAQNIASTDKSTIIADATIVTETGTVVAVISGVHMASANGSRASHTEGWLMERHFIHDEALGDDISSIAESTTDAKNLAPLLVFSDRSGLARQLQERYTLLKVPFVSVLPGPEFVRISATVFELNPENSEHFLQLCRILFESRAGFRPTAILYLWSLDGPAPTLVDDSSDSSRELLEACALTADAPLFLARALVAQDLREPPRLFFVTQGAQPVLRSDSLNVQQSGIWGVAAALRHESPDLLCRCIDLAPALSSPSDFGAPSSAEADLSLKTLLSELNQVDREDQVAYRSGRRYVARLVHKPGAEALRSSAEPQVLSGRLFHLVVDRIGLIDSLQLRERYLAPPSEDEVQLKILAAGLNFNDLMRVMGIYPGTHGEPPQLGGECSGIVQAVGRSVTHVHPGDAVIAIGSGCFASHATFPSHQVLLKPAHLTFKDAASPLVFMTAWHALVDIARLAPGDRVLIHSATGGVGLAALQIAQHVGAQVFATAGSPERRQFLKEHGILRVFDSRSVEFYTQILDATEGRGVDVVLNSVTGESMALSVKLLAPYGRFVEIGKKDIYADAPLALGHFRNNLSYAAVDLSHLLEERPMQFSRLFREIITCFEHGKLVPLPVTVFSMQDSQQAFRIMAQARHIGKIVLCPEAKDPPILPAAREQVRIRKGATYLVTGGLGGLGRQISSGLAHLGAAVVVVMGRHGSADLEGLKSEFLAVGCRLDFIQGDVALARDVARVFDHITRTAPPLRGVVHAAGEFADAPISLQDREKILRVLAPKVFGSWNLHQQTLHLPLDFFVLFSSGVTLLGSPGQANYCAANAFLDALAHWRRSRNLSALSINWGPWADVGQVAREKLGEGLSRRGIERITPADGVALFFSLLGYSAPQIAILPLQLERWRQFHPKMAGAPLFRHLQESRSDRGIPSNRTRSEFSLQLEEADRSHKVSLIDRWLREQTAQIFRVPSARVDSGQPLTLQGLDSLMSIELRHRIEDGLDLQLSSSLLFAYPSIRELASHLASRLAFGAPADGMDEQKQTAHLGNSDVASMDVRQNIDSLSDAEAEAILLERLAQLEKEPT